MLLLYVLTLSGHCIDTTSISSQNLSTEARREAVIRALVRYLGEKEEDLYEDCWVIHDRKKINPTSSQEVGELKYMNVQFLFNELMIGTCVEYMHCIPVI